MKPVVLCILDGYGLSDEKKGNAVIAAKTPNLDSIMKNYSHIQLEASGVAVGLPKGQMGNSEVGHLNIGGGRVVYQALTLINKSISEKTFFANEEFINAIDHVKKNKSKLHIMGLLSDGGVHSHIDHICALVELAKEQGIKEIYVHAFLDGRDVSPTSSKLYIKQLKETFVKLNVGVLATVSGRYYAMDRDNNMERTHEATNLLLKGEGNTFNDINTYIEEQYDSLISKNKDASDEFIKPAINEQKIGLISNNDGVIFANYRPDRAIQISTIITNSVKNIHFICMMKYSDSIKGEIAFKPQSLENVLGVYLAKNNIKQLRISETEKYAHVTFFFDGGVNYDGEKNPSLEKCERILIPSPKVATYDLQPEMSAYEITDKLSEYLQNNDCDFVVVNYANCDMVGHTAILPASIKAVEVVDDCVGKLKKTIEKLGGTLIITADHGNAECVLDKEGNPYTAHTTNPVPFVILNKDIKFKERTGKLADIAPTILKLLNLSSPSEMDGNCLID